MQQTHTAEELVDVLQQYGNEGVLRPVHAIGVGVSGFFVPSQVASDYCVAEHFKAKKTKVTVRFSNGSGCAQPHDGWSDVRGMATRFHLADGAATDLIAMTLPEFFTPTGDTFYDFAVKAKPVRYTRESPWRKILDMLKLTLPLRDPYPEETVSPDVGAMGFADTHDSAKIGVFEAATIGAPVSYVRAAYHAVHTFIVTGPTGTRRWVRFTWQPIAGVKTTTPEDALVDCFLHKELGERFKAGPVPCFTLMMVIGEAGDDFDNPSRPWPPHRRRIMMGTLTVEGLVENQTEDCERLSFNPWRLTKGIEPSGDDVLRARKEAYEYSSQLRGAAPCPFSRS